MSGAHQSYSSTSSPNSPLLNSLLQTKDEPKPHSLLKPSGNELHITFVDEPDSPIPNRSYRFFPATHSSILSHHSRPVQALQAPPTTHWYPNALLSTPSLQQQSYQRTLSGTCDLRYHHSESFTKARLGGAGSSWVFKSNQMGFQVTPMNSHQQQQQQQQRQQLESDTSKAPNSSILRCQPGDSLSEPGKDEFNQPWANSSRNRPSDEGLITSMDGQVANDFHTLLPLQWRDRRALYERLLTLVVRILLTFVMSLGLVFFLVLIYKGVDMIMHHFGPLPEMYYHNALAKTDVYYGDVMIHWYNNTVVRLGNLTDITDYSPIINSVSLGRTTVTLRQSNWKRRDSSTRQILRVDATAKHHGWMSNQISLVTAPIQVALAVAGIAVGTEDNLTKNTTRQAFQSPPTSNLESVNGTVLIAHKGDRIRMVSTVEFDGFAQLKPGQHYFLGPWGSIVALNAPISVRIGYATSNTTLFVFPEGTYMIDPTVISPSIFDE